jgi:hypothetical protein
MSPLSSFLQAFLHTLSLLRGGSGSQSSMRGRRAFGASVAALGLTNKAVFAEGEEATAEEADRNEQHGGGAAAVGASLIHTHRVAHACVYVIACTRSHLYMCIRMLYVCAFYMYMLFICYERVGLARTIYIQCMYDMFGRNPANYMAMYVYIRFWPTLSLYIIAKYTRGG